MVYDDAEKLYAEVRKDGESLLEEAFEALFQKSLPLSQVKSFDVSGSIVGFNTTSFARRDIVKIPLRGSASQLKSKVVQTSLDGGTGYALMDGSGGGSLAIPSGLYADCMPASGMSIILCGSMFSHNLSFVSAIQRIRSLCTQKLERPTYCLEWADH
jgi:alpha-mannosidase